MSDALAQARDLFLLGNEHAQAGRLAQAEQAYRQALALAPGRPSILANLGITLWRQDRQAEAVGPLQQTLRAEPDQPEAWLALGLSAEALGQWELAAQALGEGTRRHPQAAAPLWMSLGHCLGRTGQLQAAVAALGQALDLDPTLAEAWSQRGSLLRELGRLAEAAHSFEQALAHGADEALHRFYLASVRGETLEHPPASYVQNLFDDYAAEFQSHLVHALKYRAHEVLLDPLCEGDRQFAHMLDLGCGTGLCARRLQGHVARIDGVDLSAQMVAQAQASGLYRRVSQGDLLSALQQQASMPVDLILAADVFIYVGALDEVMAAARACIARGGCFAFSVEQAPPGHDLRLQENLRYAHSRPYIEQLAQAHGWRIDRLWEAPLREDQGRPVMGWYVHLQPALT